MQTTSIPQEKSSCQLYDDPKIGHTAFVQCSKQIITTKIEEGLQCTIPALNYFELNRLYVINFIACLTSTDKLLASSDSYALKKCEICT